MQLKELKKLIEYNALSCLMVTRVAGGWVVIALKPGDNKDTAKKDCLLETARGGVREFKTLDAVHSYSRAKLGNTSFTVK